MATSRSDPRRDVRTTDLSLAAYLVCEGFTPTHEVAEGGSAAHPKGCWVFSSDCEYRTRPLDLARIRFESGEARVDPATFHTVLNQTRRDMFKFLGMGQ